MYLPCISQVHPSSGPRAGGTLVTLYGVNLGNGSHYKCRFGGDGPAPAVNLHSGPLLSGPSVPGSLPLAGHATDHVTGHVTAATYAPASAVRASAVRAAYGEVVGASAVACFSPNVSDLDASVVALELSLNGQEYTRDRQLFSRHAPVLSSIY